MKSSPLTDRSLGLVLLALMAALSELLAWWWAYRTPVGESWYGPAWLGLSAAVIAVITALALWRQRSLAMDQVRQARQILAASLDTLDVGLEVWDQQDRLLLYNKKINQLFHKAHTRADIGQTFEALMRAKLARQLIPAAVGREEEWLAQHLSLRGTHQKARLKELASDRWVNASETRTPEGFLVASWVDVTELAQQTGLDELTALANRRRFDDALATEWQRASRSATPLSLLMVDIDHFKRYNDHYGHVSGDQCLRRVAEVLSRCVRRAGEMVARYGGEEFVLLLPNADLAHASETAQKCMDLMHSEWVPHVASPTSNQVTLSIGVACLHPEADLDPLTLVNAADAAMYRAKSAGRARYEVADQADWDIDKDAPRTSPAPLA